jgi:hypothetical protein
MPCQLLKLRIVAWDAEACSVTSSSLSQHSSGINAKVTIWQAYADTEERRRYSSKPLATRHRKEVGGQHHAQAVLSTRKTRYTFYSRLGGPLGRSGRYDKSRPRRDSIPGPSSP